MSMTMTQQILARHCGLESVKAGDLTEMLKEVHQYGG